MRGSNFLCQQCGHGCRRDVQQSRRQCSCWVPRTVSGRDLSHVLLIGTSRDRRSELVLGLSEVPHDLVADLVEFRAQVLGVGQANLPVGHGTAATGSLGKLAWAPDEGANNATSL